MHRNIAALTLALALLLGGCAAGREDEPLQQALDFRQKMLAGDCAFTAELAADFDDYVCAFSVSCVHTPQEGTELTILAPQSLAALRAHTDADGARLVFADTEAAFGTLTSRALSPMAAPELLAQAWESGYIAYAGQEDGQLHVSFLLGYGEQELGVETWFQNGAPVYAELTDAGRTVIQAELADLIIRKAERDNENTQANLGKHLVGQSGA